MFTPFLIAAILGYFLGAIPFGFLVARARGVNIVRQVGRVIPNAPPFAPRSANPAD